MESSQKYAVDLLQHPHLRKESHTMHTRDLASDPSAHLLGKAVVIWGRQKNYRFGHLRSFWTGTFVQKDRQFQNPSRVPGPHCRVRLLQGRGRGGAGWTAVVLYIPLITASWSAVDKLSSGFVAAPASKRRLTHSTLPLQAASHRGVEPSIFLASIYKIIIETQSLGGWS